MRALAIEGYMDLSKELISEISHLRQETQCRLRTLLIVNPCLLTVYRKGILGKNGLRI